VLDELYRRDLISAARPRGQMIAGRKPVAFLAVALAIREHEVVERAGAGSSARASSPSVSPTTVAPALNKKDRRAGASQSAHR